MVVVEAALKKTVYMEQIKKLYGKKDRRGRRSDGFWSLTPQLYINKVTGHRQTARVKCDSRSAIGGSDLYM